MQIGDFDKPQLPGLESTDAGLERARRASERGDAGETAKQFETLFATMLVRELRRSMPQGIFGDGAGADVYEGWFDEHLGNALAGRDSLGIAGLVKTSIHRAQAAADSAAGAGTDEHTLAPARASAPEKEPQS